MKSNAPHTHAALLQECLRVLNSVVPFLYMESNTYYFLLEFKRKISFSYEFSGAKIPFSFPDGINISFLFPIAIDTIRDNDSRPKLISPISFDILNAAPESWGSINYMNHSDGMKFHEMRVKSIVIESDSEDRDYLLPNVERLFSSLVKLKPQVEKIEDIINDHEIIDSFNEVGDNIVINLGPSNFAPAEPYLSLDDFGLVLGNFQNEIRIEYDLYYWAQKYNDVGNYRSELLNYATIVDTAIQFTLIEEMKKPSVRNAIETYEKKNKNRTKGYFYYKNALSAISYPSFPKETEIDNMMSLRNRVIHSGKGISCEDVKGLANLLYDFMRFYVLTFYYNQKEAIDLSSIILHKMNQNEHYRHDIISFWSFFE